MSDSADAIGGLIGLMLIVAVAVMVAFIVYILVQVLVGAGAVYGAGIALRNYGLAFAKCVQPQKAAA